MRQMVEKHGGTVEKFVGDEVMAVFGVPTVHEDDALRAVRAGKEMLDALAGLNEELDAARRPPPGSDRDQHGRGSGRRSGGWTRVRGRRGGDRRKASRAGGRGRRAPDWRGDLPARRACGRSGASGTHLGQGQAGNREAARTRRVSRGFRRGPTTARASRRPRQGTAVAPAGVRAHSRGEVLSALHGDRPRRNRQVPAGSGAALVGRRSGLAPSGAACLTARASRSGRWPRSSASWAASRSEGSARSGRRAKRSSSCFAA